MSWSIRRNWFVTQGHCRARGSGDDNRQGELEDFSGGHFFFSKIKV
jgi:hypothetical protein